MNISRYDNRIEKTDVAVQIVAGRRYATVSDCVTPMAELATTARDAQALDHRPRQRAI